MNQTKKCPRDLCLYATTVPEYNYCPLCGLKLEIIDGTAYKGENKSVDCDDVCLH